MLFDTHCHLHDASFDADRDLVVQRAIERGCGRVLAVAEGLEDAWRLLDLVPRYDGFVVPAIGLHPDRAQEADDGEVADVIALIRARQAELGAIGEVGLDFRPCWDERARDRQKEIFRAMIALAEELDLPLTCHSRSAGHHAIDELLAGPEGVTAVLHAFDGRAVHAERGAERGLHFSVPPSVARSAVKRKLVKRLARHSLLLETDSPVLGPVPGERNEPANLRGALHEIAQLRDEAPDELESAIEETTARVFPRLVEGVR